MLSPDVCVCDVPPNLGVADFVPGEMGYSIRSPDGAWREVVQHFWLP